MKNRIVITGVGAVASNGIGRKEFWSNLKDGISGIKPITLFDTSKTRCKLAGEISDFKPDFIMYVAGADPYENDQIGNLSLTMDGLKRRDEFVFSQGRNYGIPVCVVLAGGYAYRQEDTVEIHVNTIKKGIEILGE